jgi:hypothetical protein
MLRPAFPLILLALEELSQHRYRSDRVIEE